MMLGSLLIITGVLEIVTGMALIGVPSEVARILLGVPLADPVGQTVARVAGAALVSIGVGCLVSRNSDPRAARTILLSLVIYNGFVVIVLIRAFAIDHMRGIGLWPAAILHTALALWCIACVVVSSRTRNHPPAR